MNSKKMGSIPPFVYMLGFMAAAVLGANIWMVTRSNQMHEDIVRDDYYAASLKHENLLNAQRRLDSLKVNVDLRFESGMVTVEWQFMDSTTTQDELVTKLHCESHFYRSNNRQLDQLIPMGLDSLHQGQWSGQPKPLQSGPWQVSVRWYLDTLLMFEKPFKYSS